MEHVLLVEGVDDERVVRSLCKHLDINDQFQIKKTDGVDRLIKSISPEFKVPNRRALGILVDANDGPQARWQSMGHQLQIAGIDLPQNPAPNGTVVDGIPRLGIWMMPDNSSPGELEDFVVRLIPKDDSLWPRAERYIDDIPVDDRKFSPAKTSRAKLYAWLATRRSPRQMAQALEACDLDISLPIVGEFAHWIERTFMQQPCSLASTRE